MKLQLKQIDPISAGKVLGALYAAVSLLAVPFILAMTLFMMFASSANLSLSMQSSGVGTMMPGIGLFAGMGLFFVVFMPVAYGAMGFVMGALVALAYNLICRWLGGFVLEFEVLEPAAQPLQPAPAEPPALPVT